MRWNISYRRQGWINQHLVAVENDKDSSRAQKVDVKCISLDVCKMDEQHFSRETSFLAKLQGWKIKMHSTAKTMKCGDKTVLKLQHDAITLLWVCPSLTSFLSQPQPRKSSCIQSPAVSSGNHQPAQSDPFAGLRLSPAWDTDGFITVATWPTLVCEDSPQSCHGVNKQPRVKDGKHPAGRIVC